MACILTFRYNDGAPGTGENAMDDFIGGVHKYNTTIVTAL
jgi:hypothetical protein